MKFSEGTIKPIFIKTTFAMWLWTCLTLGGCEYEREPYMVQLLENKVIAIIQIDNGPVHLFEPTGKGSYEYLKAVRPNSPYYPLETIEVQGMKRKIYNFPKLLKLFEGKIK